MREFIDSLSLVSGAALVAAIAALIALAWVFERAHQLSWIPVLVIPAAISFALYWFPVWLGSNPAEYSVWEVLVVGVWSAAGASAAGFVFVAAAMLRRGRNRL